MEIKIEIIDQLNDNYSYVVYNLTDHNAIVVDPAEETPIVEFIKENQLNLIAILITHHHTDHISGIKGLKEKFNVNIYTPNKNIEGTTNLLKDKQKINFNFIEFEIIATPGHTLDHIVYYNDKNKILFCGDVLFCYGCGRVFEGTMEQMLTSLKKIKKLPGNSQVYCGHEYTYKNLEFLLDELIVMLDKDKIKQKCRDKIKKNRSSMPFELEHQKKWNPFLNCDNSNYKKGIANFHQNKGKISKEASELDFFTYIRKKRNNF